MRLEEFILKRVIFELRYATGSFAFLGKAGPMMDNFLPRFERLQFGPDFLLVARNKDRLSISVGMTRCAIDAQRAETDIDLAELRVLAAEIVGEAIVTFKKEEASRIGLRYVFLKPCDDFESAFATVRDGIPDFVSGPMAAVRYPFTDAGIAATYRIDDKHRLNLMFGPYQREEMTTKLPIQEDAHLPVAAIALDLDYAAYGGVISILDVGHARAGFRGFGTSSATTAIRNFLSAADATIRNAASAVISAVQERGG